MEVVITPQIEALLRAALDEDIGPGDVTTMSTISPEARGKGLFRAKRECVVAGLFLLPRIFSLVDEAVRLRCDSHDGDSVAQGAVVAEVEGSIRSLLLVERTALNFLQRLSGTATLTRRYVEALKGFSCRLIDTRKTTPGLRTLQKYAVRMGGGGNHRAGLYDAALIKDNHIVAAGSITAAVEKIRRQAPFMTKIEVECGTLPQVREAVEARVDVIMVDNMNIPEMAEAVRWVNRRAWIEASGGIDLENLREVAATGVDFISVGALTHSAPAADFNMKITPTQPAGR